MNVVESSLNAKNVKTQAFLHTARSSAQGIVVAEAKRSVTITTNMKIQKINDEWHVSHGISKCTDKSLRKAILWVLWGAKVQRNRELKAKTNINV